MVGKRVFVTVGTTKFEKLTDKILEDSILKILKNLGYDTIQFQIGSGRTPRKQSNIVNLIYNRYYERFLDEIGKSDLVISHAGAGTCLEVLKRRKPLIVVINEDLMDNHQTELAEQLAKDSYLYCCTVDTLEAQLENFDLVKLKPYPVADPNLFSTYLDKCMGFS